MTEKERRKESEKGNDIEREGQKNKGMEGDKGRE